MNPAVDLSSFPDSRLQPVKVGRIRRLAARWALPLVLIGLLGFVLCVLVMAGLITGLLPEHFIWLFPVGMVAMGGLVLAMNSYSPEQARELAGMALESPVRRKESQPAGRGRFAACCASAPCSS